MTELETKLAEALELIAATDPIEAALDPQRAIRVAREALRLYDEAKAEPVQDERAEFEAWLHREQPAGCVADMERGWQARAALAATPAPATAQERQAEAGWDERCPGDGGRECEAPNLCGVNGFCFHNDKALAAPPAPAPEATPATPQPCGHPAWMQLKSAETGETLYCEACDDKSGRRDAEQRESELMEANRALRAELAEARAALAAKPAQAQQAEGFDHSIGEGRYKVHKAAFWWHIRIGDGTANVGKFYTQHDAEDMALKLLTAYRDGAFAQFKAATKAEAKPLTDEKVQAIREEVFAWALARCDGCDDETWDQWFARAVQCACAEAWGVKLAGIGANSGGAA